MRILAERADIIPQLAEVFRTFGYEGTSLSRITERTGLGKGSLYHFFPGGKEEMASAVLADIDDWFERQVFTPLLRETPENGLAGMWKAVRCYFQSGGRICLVGAFALDGTRDRFAAGIAGYFGRWTGALTTTLVRAGWTDRAAEDAARDAVLGIQGALVLARAMNDPALFSGAVDRLEARLRQPAPSR